MKRSWIWVGSIAFAFGALGGCSSEPMPTAPPPVAGEGTPAKGTVNPGKKSKETGRINNEL